MTGPAGGGKKRIAGILGQLLQYYGLAQKPLHIVTPQNFTELPDADAGQPLYVPLAPQLLPEGRRNTNLVLHLFWVHLARLAEEQTVILGVHSPGGEQFMAGLDLAERIQFHIHIPVYSWGDFLAYARRYAAGYKFKLSRPAVEELREVIERQKQDPEFRNMVTVQRLIDGAIINYYIDPGEDAPQGREYATLQPQHIRPTAAPRNSARSVAMATISIIVIAAAKIMIGVLVTWRVRPLHTVGMPPASGSAYTRELPLPSLPPSHTARNAVSATVPSRSLGPNFFDGTGLGVWVTCAPRG